MTYNINDLTVEEVNVILEALTNLPYKTVNPVICKIAGQCAAQNSEVSNNDQSN